MQAIQKALSVRRIEVGEQQCHCVAVRLKQGLRE
jgi:hypothetical protein